ncbi:MAG: bifunctional diguanylate cyclase/phosphodiesterase, partial [Geminicoccaceae bacterium]|nr:bifunctional diguanylate cyclase/phosphodiesterase [Geminicoccaceae bacterium]
VIEALARAIEAGRSLAAIAIDLDHFKEANEHAGHAGGDALLRAAAERLGNNLRAGDIVGRVGGDEFVVFLLDVRAEAELRPIVERIRAALHEPVPLDGRLLPLGATLGVAICPEDTSDPEILLRLADEALVRAKRERRGSIGRASREDALAIEVARDLRIVLDRASPDRPPEGLAALLQPVVALGEGAGPALLGFEALARWTHPRLGPIPPSLLFGAAADRRSAIRLGRLVRRVALVTFAALRDRLPADARLSLNLSPAEVFADGLEEEILADLEATGVPPGAFCLEITEEVLLDRVSDRRLAGLAALRERGIALALDDFGTGTSGLAQLLRLPIDILKIDRCFVRALETDGRAREIVRATSVLAGTLGMRVVAEGVETEAQARTLESLGCQAAQGFLFGRPMGLVELHRWLEAHDPPALSPSGSSGRPLGRPEHALDPDDPAEPLGEVGGFCRAQAGELEIDRELVAGHALAVAALGHVAHRREHLEHARQSRGIGAGLDGEAEGEGHGRTPRERVRERAERPGLSARPGR